MLLQCSPGTKPSNTRNNRSADRRPGRYWGSCAQVTGIRMPRSNIFRVSLNRFLWLLWAWIIEAHRIVQYLTSPDQWVRWAFWQIDNAADREVAKKLFEWSVSGVYKALGLPGKPLTMPSANPAAPVSDLLPLLGKVTLNSTPPIAMPI